MEKIMSRKYKKILLTIILAVVMFLCWASSIKDGVMIMEEVAAENIYGEFVAPFEEVRYVVACNNDLNYMGDTDIENIYISIMILDEYGDIVYSSEAFDVSMHTNGYRSTYSTPIMTEGTAELVAGHNYRIVYTATLPSGENLDNLSFVLYGNYVNIDNVSITLMFLLFAAVCIMIWSDNVGIKKWILVWALLISVSFVFVPLLQPDDEMDAFADVYATSSVVMGRAIADDNGYVIIDESGVRNNGWITHGQSLARFWADKSYGDNKDVSTISSLYKVSKTIITPEQIPALVGVALARLLNLRFSYIYALGWGMQMIAFISIILTALYILKRKTGDEGLSSVTASLIIVPSMLLGSMSYTGIGIVIALCLLFCSLIYNDGQELAIKDLVALVIVLCIVVFAEPALIVFTYFLYKRAYRKMIFVPVLISFAIGICNAGFINLDISRLLKTFYNSFDTWIQDMSVYHYHSTAGMVAMVFTILLLAMMVFGNNCQKNWNYRIRIGLFIIGSLILLVTDAYVAEGTCGEKWIPLYMILFSSMGVQNNKRHAEWNVLTIQKLLVLCSCIMMFLRYNKM